jgi:DNA polymerase I-like protein with 3'-5' exonuclease and polymerase domains
MYRIFDLETTTTTMNKRKASPFSDENWVVAAGYKDQDSVSFTEYYIKKEYPYANNIIPMGDDSPYRIRIPKSCTLLVGFNIKFDLLYSWDHPELKAFLARGGKIWDCQYAEYLLQGAVPTSHMVSMDDIVEKYGGVLKIDEIKALWKAGVNTPDINKDLLSTYLHGDLNNTEAIFLGQVKAAREKGIVQGIMSRMDGLLCTTECEHNGLHIDVTQALDDKAMLEGELSVIKHELESALPDLPEEFEFNWGSNVHKSCLLYGGAAKYQKWTPHLDEDGNQLYAKKDVRCLVRHDGSKGIPLVADDFPRQLEGQLDAFKTYKGGKRKGEYVTKIYKEDDLDKPKGARRDYVVRFPRMVQPKDEWTGALKDGEGNPIWSVSGEIIQLLAANHPDIKFLKAMSTRDKIQKDLGTYYMTEDKGELKGMLTLLDGDFIHHSLNHVQTVTTRLSSSNPNMQNIPRNDYDEDLGREKSVVKRMFTSRFADGKMLEIDYSQLEVVVQGILTQDKQLIQDIKDGVDFHCKRLAAKLQEDYEEVYKKCHDESHPDHKAYKVMRSAAKGFTFARAFGAGKASIAANTGMSEDEVQTLIDAEEIMYPGVSKFFDSIEETLQQTRVPSLRYEPLPDQPGRSVQCGIGYYTGPTECIFGFYEVPYPAYKRKNTGREAGFYRPSIQNYPVQGTAGHLVQIALGKLFRWYIQHPQRESFRIVNTVHDCVWLDCKPEIAGHIGKQAQAVLEGVPAYLKELFNIDCPVEFPCETEIGDNLLNMKVI